MADEDRAKASSAGDSRSRTAIGIERVTQPPAPAPAPAPTPAPVPGPAAPGLPPGAQVAAPPHQTLIWQPENAPGRPLAGVSVAERPAGSAAPAAAAPAPKAASSAPAPGKGMSFWVWGAASWFLTGAVVLALAWAEPDGMFGRLVGIAIGPKAAQALAQVRAAAGKAAEAEDAKGLEDCAAAAVELTRRFPGEPSRYAEAVARTRTAIQRQHFTLAQVWLDDAKQQMAPGGQIDRAVALLKKITVLQPLTRQVDALATEATSLLGEAEDRMRAQYPLAARKLISEAKYVPASAAYDVWLGKYADADGLREREQLRNYLKASELAGGADPGEGYERQLAAALALLAPPAANAPAPRHLEALRRDTAVLTQRIRQMLNPTELVSAQALLTAGEFEPARKAFERVVAQPPAGFSVRQKTLSRFGLAQALYLLGRLAESQRELEKVNREAPDLPEPYLWKAHCLTMLASDLSDPQDEDVQAAIGAYETAAKLLPDDARPLARLAQLYKGAGFDEQATACWKRMFDVGRRLPSPVNGHETALLAQSGMELR